MPPPNCLSRAVVYNATVKSDFNEKSYVELTGNTFKDRYNVITVTNTHFATRVAGNPQNSQNTYGTLKTKELIMRFNGKS